jgi:hypothetical protein
MKESYEKLLLQFITRRGLNAVLGGLMAWMFRISFITLFSTLAVYRTKMSLHQSSTDLKNVSVKM